MNDDTSYQLFCRQEYWYEIIRRIDHTKPGSRVLLSSMTLNSRDPLIAEVLAHAARAAERGVAVTVTFDAHSFIADGQRLGPLWFHRKLPEVERDQTNVFAHKLGALNAISRHTTGLVYILNKPTRRYSLPVAGRSHIKLAIINQTVFIGSHNMDHPDIYNLSVSFDNASLSNELHKIMTAAGEAGSVRQALGGEDRTLQVDERTWVFIDAGVPGQSVIFEEALKLIDAAEQWLTITCQYFPNSITARHLLQARKRGVDVSIIYGHPKHQGFIGGMGEWLNQLIERSRLPPSMFVGGQKASEPKLHAKLIASDAGVMIGSHNYVRAGVRLGTAEIALLCINTSLAAKIAGAFLQTTERESEQPNRNQL